MPYYTTAIAIILLCQEAANKIHTNIPRGKINKNIKNKMRDYASINQSIS